MTLFPLQQLAIHSNMINFRISLAAQLSDDGPVHLNASRPNQFLGLSTGSNPCRRNDFLKPFKRHIEDFDVVSESCESTEYLESPEMPGSPETPAITVEEGAYSAASEAQIVKGFSPCAV